MRNRKLIAEAGWEIAGVALLVLYIVLIATIPPLAVTTDPDSLIGYTIHIDTDQWGQTLREYLQTLQSGSLGTNRRGHDVAGLLLPRIGNTLRLVSISLAFAIPLGVVKGLRDFQALRRRGSAVGPRALLLMAQMGIFGILFGGGIMMVGDYRGSERWFQITGLPEWGSLLSDGRLHVLSRPWIPFPPLWRWGLAALPLLGLLWYYQGLPWDRVAGIHALAARQAAALSAGDVEGYESTVAPGSDTLRADARLLASLLAGARVESVDVVMEEVRLRGARAQARLTMMVTFVDRPPLHVTRPVDLVRRRGTWYVEDRDLHTLRGYHADVTAALC